MATNFYENLIPELDDEPHIPNTFAAFAASTGQYVTVASRTEANQRLAEKGVGTGPLVVFNTSLPNGGGFESHPNTGATGEGWTQQTNRDLLAADIGTTQGGSVQTLLNSVLGGLSGLPAFAWGRTPVNVTGDKTDTFDTGGIQFAGTGVNLPFAGTPVVLVGDYTATNGVRVETSVSIVSASEFGIRVKRNGYSAGQVIFPWIAIGPSA